MTAGAVRQPVAPARGALVSGSVHYSGIDIMRFAAALIVLLNHFATYSKSTVAFEQPDASAFPLLRNFAEVGAVGVEIFFVISGFVISRCSDKEDAQSFLLNRVMRIAPALWVCGMLSLLARFWLGEPLQFLLMSYARSSVLSPVGPYIDGVVWSLVVEAVFYALIAVSFLDRRIFSVERLSLFMGFASTVYIAVYLMAIYRDGRGDHGSLLAILERYPWKLFLVRYGVFFSIGIQFYLLEQEGPSPKRLSIMLVFLIAAGFEIVATHHLSLRGFAALLIWFFSVVAMYISVTYHTKVNRLLRFSRLPIRAMGSISYPLYLNHLSFGMCMTVLCFRMDFGANTSLVIALSAVFLASYYVMVGPEKLIRRWMKRVLPATATVS